MTYNEVMTYSEMMTYNEIMTYNDMITYYQSIMGVVDQLRYVVLQLVVISL